MKTNFKNKPIRKVFFTLSALYVFIFAAPMQAESGVCHDLLNFSADKLGSSETVDFCDQFAGKTLLVVNTASQCGFTPQFKQLESLHKQMGNSLAIVGFPSDDFKQEHDDADKVAEVCYKNYGVSFTMLAVSSVKGGSANDLHKRLIAKTGQEPSWNFNKYLVSADGTRVQHLASNVIGAPLQQAILDIQAAD